MRSAIKPPLSVRLPIILGSVLSFSCGAWLSSGAQEEKAPEFQKRTIRALLATGGCCHDFDLQKAIITAGISERVNHDIVWTVVHEPGGSAYKAMELFNKPEWWKDFDIVVHNQGFNQVKNKTFVDRILKPHKEGLPAVLLHATMHSYPVDDDRWFEFCGVVSRKEEKQDSVSIELVEANKEHPALKGFVPWTVPNEEVLVIDKLFPGVTSLAQSKLGNSDRVMVNSWAHLYGVKKTRVFGTSIGHTNEAMMDPNFLSLVSRGFLWALGPVEDAAISEVLAPDSLPEVKGIRTEKTLLKLGSNLASNKSVLSSSSDGSNAPERAVDGSGKTFWQPSGMAPSWWEVDLGKSQHIRALVIHWVRDSSSHQYRIEASSNGSEWWTLVDGFEEPAGGSVSLHEVDSRRVKFLRVDLGAGEKGFFEFAVYDDIARVPSHVRSAAMSGEPIRRQSNGRSVTVSGGLISASLKGLEASLNIPEGYRALAFASYPEVEGICDIETAGKMGLFACQQDGRVRRLVDTDGDHLADQFTDFVQGLREPGGMEWDGEWLYVCEGGDLTAVADGDGDGIAEKRRTLLSGLPEGGKNALRLGIDGWLYVSLPFSGFSIVSGTDEEEVEMSLGGILRVRRDGSQLHLYSDGILETGAVAVSPMVNVMARGTADPSLAWDAALHHFTGLGHHGYPLLFQNFSEDILQPLAGYGGGRAVASLWVSEPGFPDLNGSSLLSIDQSRDRIYRHELEYDRSAIIEKAQHEWVAVHDPVGIAVRSSNQLWIAAGNGKDSFIASIEAESNPGMDVKIPDLRELGGEGLVAQLHSASGSMREQAQWEILRRDRPPVDELRLLALSGDATGESRAAAMFTLAQIPGLKSFATLVELTQSSDSQIRALAFRALGDLPAARDHEVFESLREEKSPEVIREMLVALARTDSGAGHLMLEAIKKVDHLDPRVSHTAIQVLVKLEASHVCFFVLDSADHEELWPGAMKVLSFMPRPEVVQGLVDRLLETRMAGVKIFGIKALTRLYFHESPMDQRKWVGMREGEEIGPLFKRQKWEGTPVVEEMLRKAFEDDRISKPVLLAEIFRNRIDILDARHLISLARNEPAIEPMVIRYLLGLKELPKEAVPFLKEIALSSIRDGNMRMRAATALANSESEDGVAVAMKVAADSDGVEVSAAAKAVLEEALLKSPAMGKRIDSLIRTANGGSRDPGRAAWAFLFSLYEREDLNPELKSKIESAVDSIDRNGQNQQERLMNMIGEKKLLYGRAAVLKLIEKTESEETKKAAEVALQELQSASVRKREKTIGQLKAEGMRKAVLDASGDASKGKALFSGLNCKVCHTVSHAQPVQGPFLGKIGASAKKADLMETILSPDAEIAKGFASQVFRLKDGSEITGFVSRELGESLEVKDSAGNIRIIENDEIDSRSALSVSMMPTGLVDSLTVGEFASLLAYLETLR